jgi:hypothetical protein
MTPHPQLFFPIVLPGSYLDVARIASLEDQTDSFGGSGTICRQLLDAV